MKGIHEVGRRIDSIDPENLFISEITLAELKYSVENSQQKEKNRKVLNNFLSGVKVVPIYHALDLYASEKARLKSLGATIDEFDLLIGVTAIVNNFVMVTNNTKHFQRLSGLVLEDWVNATH